MGKLTISMAIFHSYVKLPEGIREHLIKMHDQWGTPMNWNLGTPPSSESRDVDAHH